MNESADVVLRIEEAGQEGPAALLSLEDHLLDDYAIRGVNPPRLVSGENLYPRRGDFGATVLFFTLSATFCAGLLTFVAKLLRETPGEYTFKLSVGKAGAIIEVQRKATTAENLERCLQALAALGQDRAEIVQALISLGYDPKTLLTGK